MTLIMSYWHSPHILVMLGDLLLSRAGPCGDNPAPVELPARFHANQDPVEDYILRLDQKVILLNPRLAVAWAGSRVVARNILSHIRDNIGEDYTGKSVLELIAGCDDLLPHEREGVSFIFYLMNEQGQVQVQDYLTKEQANTPTQKFKFAGSGDFHFFQHGFELVPLDDEVIDPITHDLMAIFNRAAIAFHTEVASDLPYAYRYGGGFEILLPDGNVFRKIPHSSAYWGFTKEGFALIGPVFSYQYHPDGVLQINRFRIDGARPECDVWLVGSMFIDAEHSAAETPVVDPGAMVHYLIDLEHERNALSCIIEFGQQTIRVRRGEGTAFTLEVVEGRVLQQIRDKTLELSAQD